jgi:hypothetical protein
LRFTWRLYRYILSPDTPQVSLASERGSTAGIRLEGTLHNFGASTHYDGQLYGERNSKCFQIFRMSKFKS